MLKVDLDIIIAFILAEYKSPFTFKFILKRGDKSIETDKANKYFSGKKEIPIDEYIKLSSYFVVNTDTNLVDEKILKYYLLVLTSNGYKPATSGELNLGGINLSEENNLTLDFKKHSLNYLKIKFRISTTSINLIDFNSDFVSEETFEYMSGQSSNIDLNTTVDQSFSNLNLASTLNNTMVKVVPSPSTKPSEVQTNTVPKEDYEKLEKLYKQFQQDSKEKSIKSENELLKSQDELTVLRASKDDLTKSLILVKEKVMELEQFKSKSESDSNVIGQLRLQNAILEQRVEELEESNKDSSTATPSSNHEDLKEKNKIIEDLKEQHSTLEYENSQLMSSLKDLKADKTKIYNEKLAITKSLTEEIQALKVSLGQQKEDNQKLQQDNATQDLKLKELSQNLASSSTKLSDSTKLNNALEAELKALKSSNQKLELKITEEGKKNEGLIAQSAELIATNKSLIDEKNSLSLNYKSALDETSGLSILREENARLKQKVESLNSENENTIAKLESRVAQLSSTLSDLSIEKKQLEEIKKNQETTIDQLKSQLLSLQNSSSNIEADKEYFKENNTNLERKYKEDLLKFKETVQGKNQEILSLSSKVEALEYDNDKMKRDQRALLESNSSKETLIGEIENIKMKFEVREAEMAAEKEYEVEKCRKEIKDLEDKLNNKDKQNEAELSINKLKSENLKLKTELENLRKVESEYQEIKDRFGSIEKLHNDSSQAYTQLKQEISNQKLKNNNLEEELQIKTYKLNQNVERIEMLEKEVVSKTEQIGTLLNEISELERNVIDNDGNTAINNSKATKKKKRWGF